MLQQINCLIRIIIFYLLFKDSDHSSHNLEISKITHQIQIGHDVELNCGTADNKLGTPSESATHWHFKSCRQQSSCSKALDVSSWQKVQCINCGSSLKITRPTERDSGLYRCSIYPKSSLERRIVKMYFLDVRSNSISMFVGNSNREINFFFQ